MLLMIDNYDSFTYNLVQYFGELGVDVEVHRNDQITIDEIEKLKPEYLVISPGPCTPNEAGISIEAIKHFAGMLPVLGVCLGHQSIGQAFGGKIVHAHEIMHGKTSMIHHNDKGVFTGISIPFEATRYHSLVIEKDTIPDCLEITAWTYIVLTTRGSNVDVEGLPFLLETPAAYIGVIGSRRRWELTLRSLVDAGIKKEVLAKVHSPIGLELNAETPNEIAVSIMAEILMLRNGGDGQKMSNQI